MNGEASRRTRLMICAVVILWAAFLLYALLRSPGSALGITQRAAGLFGYSALFLAIVSSEYMREMRRLFGKAFLQVHHVLAVTGLVLIVVHPLSLALASGSLSVFVPILWPFESFLTWAGRPALYLIYIAALAAVARRRFKDKWRFIHWLQYPAFVLVFIHAWRLGSDLALAPLRTVMAAMAGVVVIVLAHRRVLSR